MSYLFANLLLCSRYRRNGNCSGSMDSVYEQVPEPYLTLDAATLDTSSVGGAVNPANAVNALNGAEGGNDRKSTEVYEHII